MCNHLHYSLTYDNGASVQVNDELYAKETNIFKVTLTYDDTVTASELPTSEVSISNLGITINYQQSSDALVKDNGEIADYRAYKQGHKITLYNEDYYVIENSGADKDYVVVLKDLPLTCEELKTYKVGTDINIASNRGYCGMRFGTTNDYNSSEIKTIVDKWATDKFQNDELKMVDGYSARLITSSEWSSIAYSWRSIQSNVFYWTMTTNNYGEEYNVFYNRLYAESPLNDGRVHGAITTVRPVINVYKSALVTPSTPSQQNNE